MRAEISIAVHIFAPSRPVNLLEAFSGKALISKLVQQPTCA